MRVVVTALVLASLALVTTAKPLVGSLQDTVRQAQSKLAQTRQIGLEPVADCSLECTFDCMLDGSCTLQEFCDNKLHV